MLVAITELEKIAMNYFKETKFAFKSLLYHFQSYLLKIHI